MIGARDAKRLRRELARGLARVRDVTGIATVSVRLQIGEREIAIPDYRIGRRSGRTANDETIAAANSSINASRIAWRNTP